MTEMNRNFDFPLISGHVPMPQQLPEYSPVPLPNRPSGSLASQPAAETHVAIMETMDIVKARKEGRALSQELGFSSCQTTLIVTAISELARNIILYAQSGEIVLAVVANGEQVGLLISALDKGPGIENMESVLASGYSTSGGLGLGLSGVRQIMDEFGIESGKGNGTRVFASIWLH